MTYTTPPSLKSRSSRVHAWLLALAFGPGLIAISCSDDAEPDPMGGTGTLGIGASAGNSAGGSSAGSSSGGSSNGGSSSGGSSAAGAGGSAGSAGSSSMAGSAGSEGMPDAGAGGGANASTAEFTLSSPDFDGVEGCGPGGAADVCDLFPDETTNFAGDNVSPELAWSGAPAGTQSFAIALHDLSFTQGGDPFTHWVMWNIPASATGLPGALPDGQQPGVPDADTRQVSIGDDDGFFGSGAAGNVYEFVLYALSTPSIDPGTTDPDAVEDFIFDLDEVLGTATLRARSTPND